MTFHAKPSIPSSGGSGSGTPATPTAPVIVDGKTENIGKAETTANETKATVDSDKLAESAWAKSATEFNEGSGLIVGSNGALRPTTRSTEPKPQRSFSASAKGRTGGRAADQVGGYYKLF